MSFPSLWQRHDPTGARRFLAALSGEMRMINQSMISLALCKSGRTRWVTVCLTACLALAQAAFAQSRITVQLDKSGHPVSPTLWGIFFEDINHSTDGGIYPELVRNRSFEDADQPEGWRISNSTGETAIDSSKPLNSFNRHSLLMKLNGSATIENDGYWGMNIVQGATSSTSRPARARGLPVRWWSGS